MNIYLKLEDVFLPATLALPKKDSPLVIFAHGSSSSRLNSRNQYVADTFNKVGIATLLFDLLTEEEDFILENRFDIGLISDRLAQVTRWTEDQPEMEHLKKGLFGSSTGAAAALITAAQFPEDIKAVVSRSGRPDLAGEWLPNVHSPTLFIVARKDEPLMIHNKEALGELPGHLKKELTIIPGATHAFEEPGALEEVTRKAKKWFLNQLK